MEGGGENQPLQPLSESAIVKFEAVQKFDTEWAAYQGENHGQES